MSQIPNGWAAHPNAAGWMYELANPNNMKEIPEVPAAPPAPPAAPAGPPMPAGYGSDFSDAPGGASAAAPPAAAPAPGGASYGSMSMDAARAEHANLTSRLEGKSDRVFLDFEKLTKPGQKDELVVRLLPPWQGAPSGTAWAKTARYRVAADLCPWDTGDKRWQYVDTFDQTGGPGDCPVGKALQQMMSSGDEKVMKAAKGMKPRPRVYWQGLDLKDPQKHFVQAKDEQGNVILDANNQPQWMVIPGIIPMGNSLHKAILNFAIEKGDCTNPDNGFPMKLKKSKTGPEDINVDYDAMDMERGPIDPAFRPVLSNLMDLTNLIHYRSREEMEGLARNILARYMPHASMPSTGGGYPAPAAAPYGAPPAAPAAPPASPTPAAQPPGGPWYPHTGMPGHLYNAAGQVIPDPQAAQAPPRPPAPPAPPAAPPAPPAPPAAPMAAPPGPPLPPPAAPGGYPMDGAPVAPPAPPMPGMPPGVGAPPAPPGPPAPPAPPAPPGMSGHQFESELDDDVPF